MPTDLPCSTPLSDAVEAGVFGITASGAIHPDREEVQALTEEHAHEKIALLRDLSHLEWCQRHSVDPSTDRPLKARQQARVEQQVRRAIEDLVDHYESCVAVYAEAFGDEAASKLDTCVRRFVESHRSEETPHVQRFLF